MLKIIRGEIRSIDTTPKALRSFGLVVGSVFLLIALVVFWHADWTVATAVTILAGVGTVLVVLGMLAPPILRSVYLIWMALAIVLGFVMTRVILTIVFFLVVTPIGLLMRAFGRDPLNKKIDKEANTYWIPKTYIDRSPERLEKYY